MYTKIFVYMYLLRDVWLYHTSTLKMINDAVDVSVVQPRLTHHERIKIFLFLLLRRRHCCGKFIL